MWYCFRRMQQLRTGNIICRNKRKVKIRGSFVQKLLWISGQYSRALNKAEGLSKRGALNNCPAHTPGKSAPPATIYFPGIIYHLPSRSKSIIVTGRPRPQWQNFPVVMLHKCTSWGAPHPTPPRAQHGFLWQNFRALCSNFPREGTFWGWGDRSSWTDKGSGCTKAPLPLLFSCRADL